jgi:hypothetical protein
MPNQGSQLAGDCLRHCLASSADLFSRCVIGAESLTSWAKRHDLDWEQVRGVYVMLKTTQKVPSLARRAAILMRDPGLEDEDIAEMLFVDQEFVADVRANVDLVREREPIPMWAEFFAAEMFEEDPLPAELYQRAADLRSQRTRMPTRRNMAGHRKQGCDLKTDAPLTPGIRHYLWSARSHAFISKRS